jgi:hypothetical protein
MDVFRFDSQANKSVLAYPDNCQSCGQCYFNCLGRSLTIVNNFYSHALTAYCATAAVATQAEIVDAFAEAQAEAAAAAASGTEGGGSGGNAGSGGSESGTGR